MSAHTHAPIPVDFLPLYSREACVRHLTEYADRARRLRDDMATLAKQIGYSPALSARAPIGLEITFAIPQIEDVCESLERALECVA